MHMNISRRDIFSTEKVDFIRNKVNPPLGCVSFCILLSLYDYKENEVLKTSV